MKQIFCNQTATANIRGDNKNPNLLGQVNFYQRANHVLVKAFVRGLPETDSGFFGLHIHEGNNCKGSDFADTAGHYNPEGTPHPTHAGDLPPLLFCNGTACQTVITDRFYVKDIIGRTVVIHDMPDDFTSQPSGNSGMKIACGVICEG